MIKGPQPLPLAERLMRHVNKTDGCWLWTASTNGHGYGQTFVGSRSDGSRQMMNAHRALYMALVGPIPEGLELDHLCRNKLCVNPSHLEPVSHRVNIRRATSGGDSTCINGHDDFKFVERSKRSVCMTCARERSARYRAAQANRVTVS